jgi:ATP-binding cassette, subfamily C, bacterial LapB
VAAQLQVAAPRWLPAPDAARMPALVYALHGERVGQWGVLRGQNAQGQWISEWWDATPQSWQERADASLPGG